jgi:hypothetical protein
MEQYNEKADKIRHEQHEASLGFAKEDPETITAFKTALMTPDKPKLSKVEDSDESNFYLMLDKDLGTSFITAGEVEELRIYAMAHSVCRMMKLHRVASFLNSEVRYNLNFHKSIDGFQQEKFIELKSKYEVKNSPADKMRDAGGIQR